jgi:hypothetical protein
MIRRLRRAQRVEPHLRGLLGLNDEPCISDFSCAAEGEGPLDSLHLSAEVTQEITELAYQVYEHYQQREFCFHMALRFWLDIKRMDRFILEAATLADGRSGLCFLEAFGTRGNAARFFNSLRELCNQYTEFQGDATRQMVYLRMSYLHLLAALDRNEAPPETLPATPMQEDQDGAP